MRGVLAAHDLLDRDVIAESARRRREERLGLLPRLVRIRIGAGHVAMLRRDSLRELSRDLLDLLDECDDARYLALELRHLGVGELEPGQVGERTDIGFRSA